MEKLKNKLNKIEALNVNTQQTNQDGRAQEIPILAQA